jgi:hypothetical protein
METCYKHIAVIGRVIGDDEDDIKLYENMTRLQAYSQFREDMAETIPEEPGMSHEERLSEVIVDKILVSDSPIKLEWSLFEC